MHAVVYRPRTYISAKEFSACQKLEITRERRVAAGFMFMFAMTSFDGERKGKQTMARPGRMKEMRRTTLAAVTGNLATP